MTPEQYVEALYDAGAPNGVSLLGLDRYAAALLKRDLRTVRRYRKGNLKVPELIVVTLAALKPAKSRKKFRR